MMDPIVQEVRKHRLEHTRRFKGDLKAICADLRAIQIASGHAVVRLPPRESKRGTRPNKRIQPTRRPA